MVLDKDIAPGRFQINREPANLLPQFSGTRKDETYLGSYIQLKSMFNKQNTLYHNKEWMFTSISYYLSFLLSLLD